MSFIYSCFISYRRNSGNDRFINNLYTIIRSVAQDVTNKSNTFFDVVSINWGAKWDNRIYDGIISSYFFIPIYQNSYLHEENIWCARELYHALEVEKIISKKIKGYCFILPIIHRGSPSAVPSCISRLNAKDIRQLEYIIEKNKPNAALSKFKQDIYDTLLSYHKLLSVKSKNLNMNLAKIHIPNNEEIKTWIKAQKDNERQSESEKLPKLK